MTRKERLELNELSIKIFNRSSAWYKFYRKGELAEMIELMDDGTERKYRGIKYPTLDDVKLRLGELLKEKEAKDAKAKEASEAKS